MRVAQTNWHNGAIFVILTLVSSSLVGLAAAADAVTYVVYPKDGEKVDQTGAILKTLKGFVGKGPVYTSSTKGHGVNFWRCDITDEQAKKVKGEKNVASVHKWCTKDCYDPSTSPVPAESDEEFFPTNQLERRKPTNQAGARDEMVFISQDLKKKLSEMDHKYYYDDVAGVGVTVYVVDTGANLDKKEFRTGMNMKDRAKWLKVGDNQPNDDSGLAAGKAHGTCMLSKVCGTEYGVAKKIQPVIVRVPTSANADHYLEGVSKVVDDISERKAKAGKDADIGRSVVSMSWYYPPDKVDDGWVIRMRMLLKTLLDQGVFLVAGSGNGAQKTITGYPAGYAKSDIKDLLVVGAVDNDGKPWPGTNTDKDHHLPHVWAPGYKVKCASAHEGEDDREASGTSPATASVAGLVAYFYALTIPKTFDPSGMKTYTSFLAYGRKDNENIDSIYNGYWSPNGDAPGAVCKPAETRSHQECDCEFPGTNIPAYQGKKPKDC